MAKKPREYKWISVSKKMPEKYDLVYARYEDDRIHSAWWTGRYWDAARGLRPGKRIVEWRKPPVSEWYIESKPKVYEV